MVNRKHGFQWARWLVHFLGFLPLVMILIDWWLGNLGVNPIQELEQRLGRAALYFLMATLAVTPLFTLSGWRELPGRRRTLGLYSFLYASLHFFTFAVLDYGLDLPEIGRLVIEKPYILVGLLTGLLLLALAVTSFDYLIRKMGKKWKLLHRLVYLAGALVILHYAWALKGNLFSLDGNILKPLLWGMLVLVLLTMRIPAVRRQVVTWRQHFSSRK